MYAAADRMLGRLVKVTPSSKVVGDLALHLVGAGVRAADFESDPSKYDIPDSVIGFLSGELGDPPGGWPEPFRTKALAGRTRKPVVEQLSAEDTEALAAKPRETLNRLLFPGPAKDFAASRSEFGDLSLIRTTDYLYGMRRGVEHTIDLEPGVQLYVGLEAIGDADERGMRTVITTLNGQIRPLQIRDRSVAVDVPTTERADPADPGQVAAPFAGVVTLVVGEGDTVAAGAVVATIEAMKMEASITSQAGGVVLRTAIQKVQQVEGGDLLLVLKR